MFYTCDTNGHRLHQSVFKCPRNTGYQANREVCAVVSDCENNDSVDSAICVPDAPDENVESLNSDGATEENVEGISEKSENDSTLKREESINSKTYDDISTPESLTDNPLSADNYGDNDGNLDKASSLPTQPIQDISASDGEMFNQAPNPTENAQEVHNEKDDSISPVDLQITSPPTVELDALHSVTPTYSTDINSNIDGETTEQYRNNDDESVTLSNTNTEALDSYSASTISNTPDLSSINDKSLKVDEETRDMTEAVDSYQTSTISNIPEFSPISETPSKLYEETQSATTEQYGNDDRIMTPSNSNAEIVDQNPTSILSDTSTDNPSNDFDTLSSTSASAILSPQTDINDDQYATKELLKTSPSVDSKLVDPDLDAPEVIENDSKHIDTLDLTPTTKPALPLEHITASMDMTTIIPMKQDLPAISDTDLITQNGKDSTEASPFIEQDAPITNN